MEIFALFMIFIVGGTRLVAMFSERSDEVRRRKKALREGEKFYHDRYGTLHYADTDEPYQLYHDYKTGDTYEINPYTFEKRKNVSLERRQITEEIERKKAIAKGRRLYPFEGTGYYQQHDEPREIKGVRFKDMKTGEIYVRREACGIYFYLNLKTGLFDFYDYPKNPNISHGYYDIETGKSVRIKFTPECAQWLKEKLNNRQRELIKEEGLNPDKHYSLVWRNNWNTFYHE